MYLYKQTSKLAMEQQLIKKLGLQNHKTLLEKTSELLRLLELKSSGINSSINEYAKITICIDLAATLLGITIDLVDVINQSGLKKSAYEKNKRTFQKLLDLNKPPGINEICVHLNCNEVNVKAKELLKIYNDSISKNNDNDIDLSHPQYAAMAVFQACKLNKVKILKSKILGYSYLRPSQWTRLEQQWDLLVKEHQNNKSLKVNQKIEKEYVDQINQVTGNIKIEKPKNLEAEDYETWKARIIKKAKEEIEKTKKEHLNKEIELIDVDDEI